MTDIVTLNEESDPNLLDLVAYVSGSEYRKQIIDRLESGAKQPSQLADEAGIARPHVSRALSELKQKGLVRSHSTDSRAKLYTLSELGTEVAEEVSQDTNDT